MLGVTSAPIPIEAEAITSDWLSNALGVEVTIRDHEAVGTGQMGTSTRFHLDGPSDAPRTVVVKSPATEAAVRELGATAYQREVGFYRDVAQTIDAAVPRCHHAAIDESGQAFALVLQDLAPAQQGDQIRGCNQEEAASALTTMARIHASTWGGAHIAELPWLAERTGVSLADFMGIAYATFRERFVDRLDPTSWPALEAFSLEANAWLEAEPASRAAVHGDFRLDNLLFPPDGSAAWIVDWQTVSNACPARDLAYFLGNSLTVADRRAQERSLVDHYVAELASAGVDYSSDQAWDEMRHGVFQGPLVTMLGAFTASKTERGESMFTAMADRCVAFIGDLDALDVLT